MVVVTNVLLNVIAQHISDTEDYVGVGTAGDATLIGDTDLGTPVTMSDGRNRVIESGSVTANQFTNTYRLPSTEPDSQPVNLQEIGTFETSGDTTNMGMRGVLSTTQTKDNSVEWIIRVTGTVTEG